MAVKVNSCCGCFTTKSGTIMIGTFYAAASVVYMIVFIYYLVLVLFFMDTAIGLHIVVMAYLFTCIGILASILQFMLAIMLIRGVNKREPKWVRVYVFVGMVAVCFALLSLVLATFNIVALIWAIVFAVIHIYFEIVIYSEYRNIVAEKETEALGESPVVLNPYV